MSLTNPGNVNAASSSGRAPSIAEAAVIYAEIFQLLEEYAPVWYTEELHERAAAGFEVLKNTGTIPASADRRSAS
jgi:hypothetical protein